MRLKYIDSAKGFGMLLILWGHIVTFADPVSQWASGFKITLFYFITGYLLAQRATQAPFKKAPIKKLLFSSAIPYLFYSALSILISLSFSINEPNFKQALLQKLTDTLTLNGISTLWFLPSIFFGRIIFERLYPKKSNLISRIVILTASPLILCFLFSRLQAATESPIFFKLISLFSRVLLKSLTASWFICIGFESAAFTEKLKKSKHAHLAFSLACFIIGGVLTFFNLGVDFNNISLGSVPILFFVTGLLCSMGTVGLFSLSGEKCPLHLTEFAGKNSLFIMVTHLPLYIVPIVSLLISGIMPNGNTFYNYLSALLIFVAVLIIEKILIVLKNRLVELFEKHCKSKAILTVMKNI